MCVCVCVCVLFLFWVVGPDSGQGHMNDVRAEPVDWLKEADMKRAQGYS